VLGTEINMSDPYRRLKLELHPGVARVTLHNPPLNVIDDEMAEELQLALSDLERRPGILAIVFAGSERAFSAGVDIASHDPESFEPLLRKFHAVIGALVASRKLTIASVRRHCLGGGAELALMCDLIYCCPDAIFAFPEIKLASYPPVAMVALSAVVGQKRAAELLLTARSLTAQEAHDMGLVNGVAMDPETLVTETVARVQQFSPAALALAKRAFYAWDAIHFDKGLARSEQIYMNELMKTEDAKEGIKAYVEKRRARWVGK
jgi:cyclohexa-1,5-dienecarbonyl-CoA hydratase